MIKLKREYVQNWLILGIYLAALIASLTLVLFAETSGSIQLIVLSLWVLVLAIGIYYFIKASKYAILKESSDKDIKNEIPREVVLDKKTKPQNDTMDAQAKSSKIIRRLNMQQDDPDWANELLSRFVSEMEIMSGLIYKRNSKNEFEAIATYAYPHTEEPIRFKEGEGLNGQAAKSQQSLVLKELPADYMTVFSGLGSGIPSYLGIAPVIVGKKCMYVVEIAGFRWADQRIDQVLQTVCKSLSELLSDTKG